MLYLVAKVFFTAIIIVLVSEVAKKSDQYGGLLAALGAASLADPRPAALRRMQTTLQQIAHQQHGMEK